MGLFDRFRSSNKIASPLSSGEPLIIMVDSAGVSYPLAGKTAGITQSDGEAAWMGGNRNRKLRDLKPTERGFVEAYMSVVWAYAAINIYVQKVAEILAQGKVLDSDGKEIKDHPLQTSLNLTYRKYKHDLWEEWVFWKALTGEAYIEKVKANLLDTLSIPSCFRVHNSLAMEPEIISGKVRRYTFNDESSTVYFEPDEIIFDKLRNPNNDMRGYSLLGSAIEAANIDRNVVVINKAHLKNNARPGLVFSGRERINESDMARIQEFVQDELKGAANAGGSLFMPGPFEVTTVDPPTFGDQDVLTNQQKRRIAAAVGIPVGLIDHEDAAFQLGPEKAKALYDLTLFPAVRRIQRVVNAEVLPFIDRSGKAKFDVPYDDIRAGLQDPQARATIANARLLAGGISLNEYREDIGKPVLDNGDLFYIPGAWLPVPADQIGTMQPKPSYLPFANPQVTIQQAGGLAQGVGIDVPPLPPPSTNPTGEEPAALANEGAPQLPPPPAPVRAITVEAEVKKDTPERELARWEKKALSKGGHKAADFECYAIEPGHAELIAGELMFSEPGDKAAVKAIFQHARDRLAEKALQATRLDFEGDFEDLLIAARAENINRRRFSLRLRTLLRKFGEKAYRDGLADGGVEVGEGKPLGDSDTAKVNSLAADQSSFVTNISATLFKGDGISDAVTDGKPAQWFRGSIRPFHTAGLLSADKNGMYRVVGNDGADGCIDCARLKPQVHRLRNWQKRNLILGTVGQSTMCEGWECKHSLQRTRGGARGSY